MQTDIQSTPAPTDPDFQDDCRTVATWQLRMLQVNALRSDPEAQRRLGAAHFEGHFGLMPNPVPAEEWFRRAAEQGDVIAMRCLAGVLMTCRAMADRASWQEALLWLARAVLGGDELAVDVWCAMEPSGDDDAMDIAYDRAINETTAPVN